MRLPYHGLGIHAAGHPANVLMSLLATQFFCGPHRDNADRLAMIVIIGRFFRAAA